MKDRLFYAYGSEIIFFVPRPYEAEFLSNHPNHQLIDNCSLTILENKMVFLGAKCLGVIITYHPTLDLL